MTEQHDNANSPIEKLRLAFAPGQWAEAQKLLERHGMAINPGNVVGKRYGSTLMIEHLEVSSIARESANAGRIAIMIGDHYQGWHKGYRQSLQVGGLQQLGWWMHLEEPPDAEVLDRMDRLRILEQPEWAIASGRLEQRPDPLFLATWPEGKKTRLRAGLIIRATNEFEECEIELNS